MSQLFGTIRRSIADSRTIAQNTGLPQYKIGQLKMKLFLVVNSQPEEVCEWWERLRIGEPTRADIERLKRAINELK